MAPGRRATALKERAKVARASTCDINVEKNNDFVRFRLRARVQILKIRAGFFRGPTVRFV